jgi:CubicO group peptidase (beta-lactamase class C family)
MKRNKILYAFLAVLVAVISGAVIYLNSLLPIITGYAAKNLCSGIFVSGRKQADMEGMDLNFSYIKYTRNRVNYADKSVVSRFLWRRSKAIYREGFGTTLLRGVTESDLRKIKYPGGTDPGYAQDTIPWPMGDMIIDTITTINRSSMEAVTRKLINENGYNGNAFAFLVLYRGIPVTEAYKPQFSSHTRFLSWSIAKSFTNALTGILVMQGKMAVDEPAGIKEWKGDERSKITLNDLLQMQSGLKWNEDYGNRSDITLMLHCESDMARFAYEKPAEHPAGTVWEYSSGADNIVSFLIRQTFSNDSLYYTFADNQLFNRTGMPDAVWEVDPSGTRVGSSYIYATARDYARFGLLYLNDGIFGGERILPEGWVKYTVSESSDSNGKYGAFFWLNRCRKYPSAPDDMFSCEGHDGQMIFIIPSQELVVVVLGYSPSFRERMDFDRLLGDILKTLRQND